MALPAIQTPGASSAGTDGVLITYAASVALGDTLIMVASGKYPHTSTPMTFTGDAGWNHGHVHFVVSSTGHGVDNGNVWVGYAWKIADATDVTLSGLGSGASFNVTPKDTSAGNPATAGIMQRFTTTSGTYVGIDHATAEVATEASGAQTVNFTPDLSWNTDDLAAIVFGGNTDSGGYAPSGSNLTIAGSTLGTYVEQAAVPTSQGDDCKLEFHRKPVTSGGGSGAAATTFTVGGVLTSSAILLLRLREVTTASTVDTTAASTGAATVTGVGASTAETTAAATGTALATGVAGSIQDTTAASTGTATATGVSGSVQDTTAEATGAATVIGVGGVQVETTGSAVGTSVVTGVSGQIVETLAQAVGTSSVYGHTLALDPSVATVRALRTWLPRMRRAIPLPVRTTPRNRRS